MHTTLNVRGIVTCVAVAAFVNASLPARAGAQRKMNTDPEAAQFVMADIPNFWRAFDRLSASASRKDSVRALFEEYYLPASPGLESWLSVRVGSPYDLLNAIERAPRFYGGIRKATLEMASKTESMRAATRKLKDIYPGAVFPDVYFLIGTTNSGGTSTDKGLLIGAELKTRVPGVALDELGERGRVVESPDNLACVVVHELMHAQQAKIAENTLLAATLIEGGADFVTSLVCGRTANEDLHPWGAAHADQLWSEFQQDMGALSGSGSYAKWLYGYPKDRPKDLGYWMGYRITRAYYERASDKRQALYDIFHISDPAAFLAASGYK